MKEYGGYLEWERYYGKEYHDGYRVDSVRSALAYTIKKRKYTHVWIPYYVCDCISQLLDAMEMPYSQYHIDASFLPILPDELPEGHCVLVVNYYGQVLAEDMQALRDNYNIFLDNTQAFFEKPIVKHVDMANSCRKFLGVTGGGYFYTSLPMDEYDSYERDTAYDKAQCLIGRYETSASEFYPRFIKNEEIRRGYPCRRMSLFVQNILKSLDYEKIMQRRSANFACLGDVLGTYNRLCLKMPVGPFMYPFLTEHGESLKKRLIQHKVYIPTLWPGVDRIIELNPFERDLIDNLVLLPVDQRYDENDMEYIAQLVLELR